MFTPKKYCKYCGIHVPEGEECCKLEDIKGRVKTVCVICGIGITTGYLDKDTERHISRGNFCTECNVKCTVHKSYLHSHEA